MRKNLAFTLLEVVVVVAVIGLLAIIASANWRTVSTRSKVSQVHGDLVTVRNAMEAYYTDQNVYPDGRVKDCGGGGIGYPEGPIRFRLVSLTTPVAYLPGLPTIPYKTPSMASNEPCDEASPLILYQQYHANWMLGLSRPDQPSWQLWDSHYMPTYALFVPSPASTSGILSNTLYDPSNGTSSKGWIVTVGAGRYDFAD